MKQKIKSILDDYQYHDKLTQSDVVGAIVNLFPKPRYPAKDGWPEEDKQYLFKVDRGDYATLEIFEFNRFLNKENLIWWIPVSEILGLVEV